MISLFNKDIFGNVLILKKWLIRILGFLSYNRFAQIDIEGTEIISLLPKKNVLFVANHQTYFADATAMIHIFNASLNGNINSIKNKSYLWRPKLNIYFIAAKETMNSGLIPKILSYTGSISVERTWREKGKQIKRNINTLDVQNINRALQEGWLITFPQGTTKPGAPVRKGTAYMIKASQPIVVPVLIEGFDKAFDKTGLKIKQKGVKKKIKIKDVINIDYTSDSVEDIVRKISVAIEQSC